MLKSKSALSKLMLYSAENVSAMLFGLVGMALIARVFGPENMGRLSVVQAVSTICMFLATFGLDHFVVRDFAVNKDDGELKGSLILTQAFGWLLYLATILVYFALDGSLANDVLLIMSVAVSTYFLRSLFFKLYLQAVNDAASIAISAVVSRVVAVFFLLIGAYHDFSFELMVMYLPIQALVQAMMMLSGYRKAQVAEPSSVNVSPQRIKRMLREAMPVMLSTAIYFGYSQADILIISHFLSMKDVGIYSAAMRLVPQAAFLGHITVITFYPALSDHYHQNKAAFAEYATKIVRVQFSVAFMMAVSFSLLAPIVVSVLYGDKFFDSAAVLSIGVWAWLFMFPASLFTRILVIAKLAKYDLYKVLIVAPVSLALNFLLIPTYGYMAAAFVCVFTFFLVDFLIYALFKETRFIFKIGVNAIKGIIFSPIDTVKESVALVKGQA